MRVFRHAAEILLEGKADLPVVSAGSHNSCHRLNHRVYGSVIRAPAGQVRIKAVAHHGHSIRLSLQHRQLRHHSLRLRQLILSAVGHQHAACADGAVEHLHKPLLGAHIQVFQGLHPLRADVAHFVSHKIFPVFIRQVHSHGRLLMSAVRIQKSSGNIDNLFSSPEKHKSRALRHLSYRRCLQIFLRRIGKEGCFILLIHDNCHTLLRLGDGNLRSIQARVFLRNQIQIYPQSCRQLADRYRYTARAEVVALLDKTGYLRAAEQSLNLPLRGRVSFLHLGAAGLDRRLRVHLGRTGGSAAAVTACPSAQQNNQIARIGGLADHITAGSRSHNRADLHTLRHIIRMIDFLHIPGSQTDLVSIGAVALGCSPHQLLLGQLALQGLLHGYRRISRSCHTHGLIYISSS